MSSVKEAVKAAADYLQMLYEGEELEDLRLEEVERIPGGNWRITYGFTMKNPYSNALQALAAPSRREYKVIEVDNQSGEAISMRIREPIA